MHYKCNRVFQVHRLLHEYKQNQCHLWRKFEKVLFLSESFSERVRGQKKAKNKGDRDIISGMWYGEI